MSNLRVTIPAGLGSPAITVVRLDEGDVTLRQGSGHSDSDHTDVIWLTREQLAVLKELTADDR